MLTRKVSNTVLRNISFTTGKQNLGHTSPLQTQWTFPFLLLTQLKITSFTQGYCAGFPLGFPIPKLSLPTDLHSSVRSTQFLKNWKQFPKFFDVIPVSFPALSHSRTFYRLHINHTTTPQDLPWAGTLALSVLTSHTSPERHLVQSFSPLCTLKSPLVYFPHRSQFQDLSLKTPLLWLGQTHIPSIWHTSKHCLDSI